MPSSPSRDDFQALCSGFLDGSLNDADCDRFVEWLERDPAKLEELKLQLWISGALARMRPELSDETFLRSVLPHLQTVSQEADGDFSSQVMGTIRFARARRAILAIAATIIVMAVSFFALQNRSQEKNIGSAVGQLYGESPGQPEQVRAVHIGETLEFSNGVSKLEFADGAVMAIEAPAELVIRSTDEVLLKRGRLNAWCPETAHGFRVVTNSATLTDLGTSFGVSAAEGSSDFVVLEGKVDIRKNGETRTVVKGMALRVPQDKEMEELDFQPDSFRRTWPVASGIHSTKGEVVPAPPATPEVLAAMEDNERILVIPERRDFKPSVPIHVDITKPGVYEGPNLINADEFRAAGMKVRSYSLRYNPVGILRPRATKIFEGSVTFDRQVLAIITASRKLERSDRLLSNAPLPKLKPHDAELRGLERSQPPFGSDAVTLSEDRRTITVKFHAGESVDEIRAITTDD